MHWTRIDVQRDAHCAVCAQRRAAPAR